MFAGIMGTILMLFCAGECSRLLLLWVRSMSELTHCLLFEAGSVARKVQRFFETLCLQQRLPHTCLFKPVQ